MSQSGETAVVQTLEDYFAAWRGGDLDRMMSFVTDDVVYMPADGHAIRGRDDLRNYYADFAESYDFDLQHSVEEAQAQGDWAYVIGLYTIELTAKADPQNTVSRNGRYYMHFVSEDGGGWLMSREIVQPTADRFP